MLDFEQTDGIAGLRAAFEAHGYLRPEAAAVLGVPFGTEPRRLDMPLYLRRLDAESPLHTLIRLFALQLPASEAQARAALAPLGLPQAQTLGIVELREGFVLPRVGFVASEGLVVARDMPVWGSEELRGDHVVGLNPPAMLLARLTVRRRVRTALDLGCGGGFQSLLAARHAERVVGVDLNPRAVAFARFNARLNGVSNVEFREGDLFAPVAGERFELVVCNPPYVVSPETELLFRDGGRGGDAFCREVVAGAARHLAPGGFATVVVNWIAREGDHWSEPLRDWVSGSGCDAWLLHLDTSDVLTYAAAWNREGDIARYEAALERWMAYYARNGIRSIGMGAVVLRRSEGREPWLSALELPSRPRGDASDALLEAFAGQDRLAELATGDALFAARFRVSPQLRVAQVAAMKDGRFEPAGSELQLAGALPFAGQADAGTLRLLQLADGRRTLGEILAELAGGGAVPVELERSVGETARRLLALGFLAPAEEAGGRRGHGMAVEFQPEARAAAPRAAGGRRPRRPRRGQAGLGAG
jgi:SAM-dependent methyltransferase